MLDILLVDFFSIELSPVLKPHAKVLFFILCR